MVDEVPKPPETDHANNSNGSSGSDSNTSDQAVQQLCAQAEAIAEQTVGEFILLAIVISQV